MRRTSETDLVSNTRTVIHASCFLTALIVSMAGTSSAQQLELVPQLGHSGSAISAFAFNDDKTLVATGGNDQRVILFDAKTGIELRATSAFGNEIGALTFFGKDLIVKVWAGPAYLMNIATGVTRELPGDIFSPSNRMTIRSVDHAGKTIWRDGRYNQYPNGSDKPVAFEIFDTSSGVKLSSLNETQSVLAFISEDTVLVHGTDDTYQVRRIANNIVLHRIKLKASFVPWITTISNDQTRALLRSDQFEEAEWHLLDLTTGRLLGSGTRPGYAVADASFITNSEVGFLLHSRTLPGELAVWNSISKSTHVKGLPQKSIMQLDSSSTTTFRLIVSQSKLNLYSNNDPDQAFYIRPKYVFDWIGGRLIELSINGSSLSNAKAANFLHQSEGPSFANRRKSCAVTDVIISDDKSAIVVLPYIDEPDQQNRSRLIWDLQNETPSRFTRSDETFSIARKQVVDGRGVGLLSEWVRFETTDQKLELPLPKIPWNHEVFAQSADRKKVLIRHIERVDEIKDYQGSDPWRKKWNYSEVVAHPGKSDIRLEQLDQTGVSKVFFYSPDNTLNCVRSSENDVSRRTNVEVVEYSTNKVTAKFSLDQLDVDFIPNAEGSLLFSLSLKPDGKQFSLHVFDLIRQLGRSTLPVPITDDWIRKSLSRIESENDVLYGVGGTRLVRSTFVSRFSLSTGVSKTKLPFLNLMNCYGQGCADVLMAPKVTNRGEIIAIQNSRSALVYKNESDGSPRSIAIEASDIENFACRDKLLAIAKSNGMVMLHDIDTKSHLCTLISTRDQQDWLVYTPEGLFDSSPNGSSLIGFRIAGTIETVPLERFQDKFWTPGLLARIAAGERPVPEQSIANSVPPQVSFSSGLQAGEVNSKNLSFDVTAISRNGKPIRSFQLLIDGRPYRGELGTKPAPSDDLIAQTVRYDIELPRPGKYKLKVFANTEFSKGASEELEIVYLGGGLVAKAPDLYVLAIGVGDHSIPARTLDYADDDAKKIAEAFERHGQPLYGKIESYVLSNEQATRRNIFKGLQWLRERMANNDGKSVGIVFFAGHGEINSVDGTLYFLPYDSEDDDLAATAIDAPKLKNQLAAIPGRLILMFDACHAGAVGANLERGSERRGLEALQRDLTSELNGLVMLLAAKENQKAQESRTHGHGVYTQAILEALSGRGNDGDGDESFKPQLINGGLYLSELNSYVNKRVRQLSKGQQTPSFGSPKLFSDFPLAIP